MLDKGYIHRSQAVSTKRLARYFGTTARFWLNLQAQHDLDTQADRLGDRLDREVTTRAG